jgi:alpha-galactosidase/6-phospho-beta-glucosidase family protein
MIQKAAMEAASTLDREKIYHAILLDPNTVDDMIKAEAKWLPSFQ